MLSKLLKEIIIFLGFVVLRINKYNLNYPVGYIVDLISLPNRLDVLFHLIKVSMSYFENHDTNIIYFLSSNKFELNIMNKFGFIKKGNKKIFHKEYKKLGIKNLLLNSNGLIHFKYGNYDTI